MMQTIFRTALSFAFVLLGIAPATAELQFEAAQTIPRVEGATRTRIDAGSNGDFHLSYFVPAGETDGEITRGVIAYVRLRSGDWTEPLVVGDLGKDSVPTHYADVAGDRNGDAYVVWVTQDRKRFFFSRVSDAKAVAIESRPTRNALRSEVVVDSFDTVWAFYRDKGPEENWMLSRPIGGPNELSTQMTPVDADEVEGQRQFSVVAGAGGLIFYGYRWMTHDSRNRKLALRRYDVNRGQWSEIIDRFSGRLKPWGPQLAVDSDNLVHAVWNGGPDEGELCYRAPDGTVVPLGPGVGEDGWPPTVAVSNTGEIIVVSSTAEQYRTSVATGTVEYRIGRGVDFSVARDVDENARSKSWGGVATNGEEVLITWVADGRIHYRLGRAGPE